MLSVQIQYVSADDAADGSEPQSKRQKVADTENVALEDDLCAAFAERWILQNEATLRLFASALELNWISPHRPGKPLLVLDLDHTLVDFDRRASDAVLTRRPHLEAFLETCYAHFDVVIWSQTSWRWLEVKLTDLGILANKRLAFVLDKRSMFRVLNQHDREHRVKALELIWRRCDFWNARNTVHVDDLARNFALNPAAGLQCRPFLRDASLEDVELALLSSYLTDIVAPSSDFTLLDHSHWRTAARGLKSPTHNNGVVTTAQKTAPSPPSHQLLLGEPTPGDSSSAPTNDDANTGILPHDDDDESATTPGGISSSSST
mmetsp:Transcript_19526/g.60330  ORF Transcript_19526/g.60330 Transcript_19526/m.60330 type:complete len:319 (-) Transcript_19526:59-1015(-)